MSREDLVVTKRVMVDFFLAFLTNGFCGDLDLLIKIPSFTTDQCSLIVARMQLFREDLPTRPGSFVQRLHAKLTHLARPFNDINVLFYYMLVLVQGDTFLVYVPCVVTNSIRPYTECGNFHDLRLPGVSGKIRAVLYAPPHWALNDVWKESDHVDTYGNAVEGGRVLTDSETKYGGKHFSIVCFGGLTHNTDLKERAAAVVSDRQEVVEESATAAGLASSVPASPLGTSDNSGAASKFRLRHLSALHVSLTVGTVSLLLCLLVSHIQPHQRNGRCLIPRPCRVDAHLRKKEMSLRLAGIPSVASPGI